LFDGVLEMPGRIIIMTSNNPERLDHALIRPGRIDIVANYSNCTNETIKQMIAFFYNCTLDVDDCEKINGLVPLLYTPAEVGKILFENFGNKDGAIDCLLLAKEEEESKEEEEEEEEEESKAKEPKTSSIYNSGFDFENNSDPLSYESYSSSMSSSLYK
jgi:SpoVK/Ycf46/Vps4 family AAA+-type ATPase